MKKTFKRTSLIVTFLFSLSVLLGLTAFSVSASEDDFSAAVLAYIEETQKSDDRVPDNIRLDDSVALLNDDNEYVAQCFFLKPAGYVIIRNDYVIAEAAFSDTKSAQMLRKYANKSIYYGGALTYFTQSTEEGKFTEILSGEELNSFDAVATIQAAEDIARLSTQTMVRDQSVQAASSLSIYIRGSLRTGWNYNPDGRCGATAAAINLAYFADYIDSWVVPSWHMTSTGQSLTELLTPWIHPTDSSGNATGGAYAEDVVAGFNTYFRWRGISDRYTAFLGSMTLNNTLLNYVVDGGIPVVILISNHPTYADHFVVSHGVVTNSNISSVSQVIVNDGWGSNNVRINISYCVAAIVMTSK